MEASFYLHQENRLAATQGGVVSWQRRQEGLMADPRNAYRSGGDGMSDFEMISIYLMVLSLVVLLLKKDK